MPDFAFRVRWLLLLGLLGCYGSPPKKAELPVPKVTVQPVAQEETVDYDEYTGRTEASRIVEVRSRVYGFLQSMEFRDGDLVQEGQLLFKIEPDEYQAIHDQSRARVALAQARLELNRANRLRNEALLRSGAVSREEYESSAAAEKEADAAIVAAQADANRTALDLKYTVIHAPIEGRIDRALVAVGNLITGGLGQGTMLTTIVDEQPMYVYFDVDEQSLLRYVRLSRGTDRASPVPLRDLKVECLLQLADEKDFPHRGMLDFSGNQVDPSTGTGRLRAVFANADRLLKSGLFVRVRIPVSQPYSAMLVPEEAIASDQDLKYVYVVSSEDVAERRNVELGRLQGSLRIIKSGLAPGDRIIVRGLQRVRPGQKVEPIDASPKLRTRTELGTP